MVIGAIVLVAALTVLDTTLSLTTRVSTRVDTLQPGRNAMDLMIRDLRSQNCVNVLTSAATGATSMNDSLIGGSATSVDFYTDLGDGSTPPTYRTLTFSPTAKTIVETIVQPARSRPARGTSRPARRNDVAHAAHRRHPGRRDAGLQLLRLRRLDAEDADLRASDAASAADEARTVRISIAFKVQRTGGTTRRAPGPPRSRTTLSPCSRPHDADPSPECST